MHNNGETSSSLLAVQQARSETPAIRFSTPQDIVVALMRVSTMIGCPPPNPAEFSILNEELRATQETLAVTTGEIVLAYRLAISGNLDHKTQDLITYGQPLTVFHIVRVVQSYRRWKLQQQALQGEPVEEAHQPTREERVNIMISGARRAWDTYKATGQIVDYGGVVHAFLLLNEFFTRDAEEIEAIRKAALAEYRVALADTTSKSIHSINEARRLLNDLAAGAGSPEAKAQLLTIRRRISLQTYFEELTFSEQQLGDLLSQKPTDTFKLKSDDNVMQLPEEGDFNN